MCLSLPTSLWQWRNLAVEAKCIQVRRGSKSECIMRAWWRPVLRRPLESICCGRQRTLPRLKAMANRCNLSVRLHASHALSQSWFSVGFGAGERVVRIPRIWGKTDRYKRANPACCAYASMWLMQCAVLRRTAPTRRTLSRSSRQKPGMLANLPQSLDVSERERKQY